MENFIFCEADEIIEPSVTKSQKTRSFNFGKANNLLNDGVVFGVNDSISAKFLLLSRFYL